MNKIMGLDLGTVTCGIAMSDLLGMIATGLENYRFEQNDYETCANHVIDLVKQYDVKTIVLGLPKHMNGDIGERAQASIDFKEMLLARKPDLNIVLVDERLTTKVAEQSLIFADVSRKKRKKVIDKMAAVNILQGYLDRH